MSAPIERVIEPNMRDIGDFTVRRVLPSRHCRAVGPFVFFDHMGPIRFDPGHGVAVRPHPHIGLATITYLFDGEIIHRDSLGFVQAIRPGDVNWMTAGRGIVHSERSSPEIRAAGSDLHGIQLWVALPKAHEETEPSFFHHPKASLPHIEREDLSMRLIAGSAFGHTAPIATFSDMFYVDVLSSNKTQFALPNEYEERAVYIVDGSIEISGQSFGKEQMVVLGSGQEIDVRIERSARVLLLGGQPLDGERHLWWNFVSSSKERIDKAKDDWHNNRFSRVPGETEFIPLP